MSETAILFTIYFAVVFIGALVIAYHDVKGEGTWNEDDRPWGADGIGFMFAWPVILPFAMVVGMLALMFWCFNIVYVALIIIVKKLVRRFNRED